MSGALFLAIGAAICVLDVAVAFYFVNQGSDLALRTDADRAKAETARRVGRSVLIVSPLVFLLFAALAFGLVPVAGVEPIRFN
ncbi:MAG TPA: hypothetical protein VD887_04735 [Allosphingosinicella sp.]|nr:hypothetical protein [Allosphingosinicella sp.]